MDPILQFLLISIGTWLGLILLGSLTQFARRRAQQLPPPPEEPPLLPAMPGEAVQPFPYEAAGPEKEHLAEYWWKRLLSGQAVLGALFVPLQLFTLCANSYILALRMEMLLGQPGSPLFALNIFGWERDITFFDLVGCLISLILVVAAAVYANRTQARGPKFLAAGAWVLMVVVEVLLSVLGALNSGDSRWLAALNGALALGLALADSLFGLYMLELFLIPLVLALAWTVALPIRVAVKAARVKASGVTFNGKPPAAPKPPQQKKRIIYSIIGSLDPLFEPLRNLDAVTGRFVRHLLRKVRNLNFKTKGATQMSKSNLAKTAPLLLLCALTLTGCDGAGKAANTTEQAAGVTIKRPGAPLHYFLAVDVTPTVRKEEFAEYPQIAAHSVLSCLRHGDRVYQLLINSDAEGKVATHDIVSSKTGLNNEALKIYDSLKAIQRDRSRQITTNLASVLSYVKTTVNEARKERERLQQQGKSVAPEVRYAVVLLTDGLPDGRQTIASGEWPTDVHIWAFGVRREHAAKFRQLCVEQMKIPADSLHIKLFSTWAAAVRDFGPAIGRKPNAELLNYLLTGAKVAAAL